MKAGDVTIAIPTYNRGAILVETLQRFLSLEVAPREIIVIDQTPEHPAPITAQLQRWDTAGAIRWLRLDAPSIPRAMNRGFVESRTPIVLFLDDDVVPVPRIVAEHAAVYDDPNVWAVVGQCLEPNQQPAHITSDGLAFSFNHDAPRNVTNVIAMNLSVRRERALELGGFDENFVMVAYRFESEFALRLTKAGGTIRFDPRARVDHLRLATGGTRTYGDHKTSSSPAHSVGDYYYALRHIHPFWPYALHRLRTNVLTRFHATHPWTIPGKLLGEWRGWRMAKELAGRGPKLLG
ncbi:MAG TPA: glycosyltransferase [Thermoanaerobaculia bacterium]|nr:glycosyltransferase [Thermoanaerobaculia bacterium]